MKAEIEAYPDITTIFLLTDDKALFKALIDAGYRSLSLSCPPAAREPLDHLITDLQQQLSLDVEALETAIRENAGKPLTDWDEFKKELE